MFACFCSDNVDSIKIGREREREVDKKKVFAISKWKEFKILKKIIYILEFNKICTKLYNVALEPFRNNDKQIQNFVFFGKLVQNS